MRPRALVAAVLIVVFASVGGVAYAAFTATTSNSSNSVAAASSFGRCLADEVLADNPAAYWRMDDVSGPMVDRTGQNDGSYTASSVRGQDGALGDPASKSVSFATSGAYAGAADSASLQVGDTFTYEAWIKRDSANGRTNTIMFKGSPATSGGPWLQINSADQLLLASNASSPPTLAGSSAKITDTRWHQVVATKSGATIKLYIDGVDRTSATANTTLPSTAGSPLNISTGSGSSNFGGRIDEVSVYRTALSAARVRAHFNSGRCFRDEPRADGATAQWRLGEPSGAPMTFDSLNTNNGVFVGEPSPGQSGALAGDDNTAVSFDGIDDSVSVPDRPGLRITGDLALEAWIKPTALPSAADGYARIIGKGNGANRNYGMWLASDGKILFQQCQTDCSVTGPGRYALSSTSVATNSWSHLAATISGNTMRVYIDGVEVASTTKAYTPPTNADPLVLGVAPGAHGYFRGAIDEAAVYSGGLSAARVRDHYVAGRSYRDVVMDSNPIHYWRFGETSGNIAANEVAGGNAAVLFGSYARNQPAAPAGEGDPSAAFTDGSTGYSSIVEQANQRLAGNMTIETWVRPSAAPADYARIFGKGDTNNRNYGLWIASTRQVFFQQCNVNCSQVRQTPVSSALTLGEWYHVAATVSGNTVTLYVNGQSVGSTTAALTPATNTDRVSFAAAGYYSVLAGWIDESALYNRALPADEIAAHYAAGIRQPR